MSYDIELLEPLTKDVIQLPVKHIMTGGIYQADFDAETGTVSPHPTRDAWLNVTYNYSHYYYEATEGDERFAHKEVSAYYADGTRGPMVTEYGIRGIRGKTGAESIPMLKDMIERISEKYMDKDGNWLRNSQKDEGNTKNYWESTAANAIVPLYQLIAMACLRPDGIWDID